MCGWRAEPDAAGIAARARGVLRAARRRRRRGRARRVAADGNPDAIYTYDPALVSDAGALLLHPGKECRRAEVPALAEDFERAGVPVAGRLERPMGRGRRLLLARRAHAARRLRLPHERGRDRAPARAAARRRGARVRPSPLARTRRGDAPDVADQPAGARPRRRLPAASADAAGPAARGARMSSSSRSRTRSSTRWAPTSSPSPRGSRSRSRATRRPAAAWSGRASRCSTYRGEELSKGDGGPTCLTRPLLRA